MIEEQLQEALALVTADGVFKMQFLQRAFH